MTCKLVTSIVNMGSKFTIRRRDTELWTTWQNQMELWNMMSNGNEINVMQCNTIWGPSSYCELNFTFTLSILFALFIHLTLSHSPTCSCSLSLSSLPLSLCLCLALIVCPTLAYPFFSFFCFSPSLSLSILLCFFFDFPLPFICYFSHWYSLSMSFWCLLDSPLEIFYQLITWSLSCSLYSFSHFLAHFYCLSCWLFGSVPLLCFLSRFFFVSLSLFLRVENSNKGIWGLVQSWPIV